MKKLFALILIASAGMGACVANAEAHGYYRGGCCYRGGWVAPAIIGGVIGYELSRPYYPPAPVYYPPPPVVYAPPPVYVQQPAPYASTCTRYIIQNEQGQTVREETRCN